MAFLASQFYQFFVHHVHKGGNAACRVLCQGIGCLVAGYQKHGVETVFHGELVSGYDADFISAVCFHLVDSGRRKCYSIIQIAIFQDDECCQNLGDAGWRISQVDILSV